MHQITVCGTTGYPLTHSLSPFIHNAGYQALGFQFVYLTFESKDISFVIQSMREFGWRGLSVTMPHKISALKYLNTLDPLAKKIGAINTIVNTEGTLKGYNTDVVAIRTLLRARTTLRNKKVLIVGGGGAARAAAAVLKSEHASITIAVRKPADALPFAHRFNINVIPLSSFLPLKRERLGEGVIGTTHERDSISMYDIIINATPIGMRRNDPALFDYSNIEPRHIIYDFVYQPRETPLIKAAQRNKAHVIYGYEMLLEQAYAQFALFTGHVAPRQVMRKTLLAHLR